MLASLARADTATCFTFAASPDTYSAPPGGVFTVYTTYTNCGSEGYVVIGDSFGSDASPYVTWPYNTDFYDPFFFLGPGESRNAPFAWYRWDQDAPPGYSQTFNIDAAYGSLEARCNGTSIL